ncbi:hypothetical protein Nepgr_017457 [Nepenthes gracilis]|uniref:Uncharacterized protein n=1 Tax=Nepenthes gracilis TaxID=150966 RepID=A0AAD3XTD4_NEPGR|nr:hypothetical protein Nepgr_017457 [Nepenthes gracilis]
MGLFSNTMQPSSIATEDDTATSNFNTRTNMLKSAAWQYGQQGAATAKSKQHWHQEHRPSATAGNTVTAAEKGFTAPPTSESTLYCKFRTNLHSTIYSTIKTIRSQFPASTINKTQLVHQLLSSNNSICIPSAQGNPAFYLIGANSVSICDQPKTPPKTKLSKHRQAYSSLLSSNFSKNWSPISTGSLPKQGLFTHGKQQHPTVQLKPMRQNPSTSGYQPGRM